MLMNLFHSLFIWTVLMILNENQIDCKTTLSKIQYINAIRDIIEGLIKSLATRQKIEQNKRLELYEYRKAHQSRLGKDILVCKLCREIFVDPEKYFDHAHFHVVEKLHLALTTNVNIQCKLCDYSCDTKYNYYKHCYEEHFVKNIDKLTATTTLATTTSAKSNDINLYCKICNVTLKYPEQMYLHSYKHLQDNIDILKPNHEDGNQSDTVGENERHVKTNNNIVIEEHNKNDKLGNGINMSDSVNGDERMKINDHNAKQKEDSKRMNEKDSKIDGSLKEDFENRTEQKLYETSVKDSNKEYTKNKITKHRMKRHDKSIANVHKNQMIHNGTESEDSYTRKKEVFQNKRIELTETCDKFKTNTIEREIKTNNDNRKSEQLNGNIYEGKDAKKENLASTVFKYFKSINKSMENIFGRDDINRNATSINGEKIYSTASRIVEKIAQSKVRIVRITKDLRTTKKIILNPYTGDEEFTGDAFEGQSGEDRYDRILKKMRVTKIYMRCPWCPLRFNLQAHLLAHVGTHNLSHLGIQPNTEILFSTLDPKRTVHIDDKDMKYLEENFMTFDEWFFNETLPPEQDWFYNQTLITKPSSTTPSSTTLSLKDVSDLLGKIMNPGFIQGLFSSPKPTRNIDYLHRDRPMASTLPHLSKVFSMMNNLKMDLVKMATDIINDYGGENFTDSPEVYPKPNEQCRREEINQRETIGVEHGGIKIEEIKNTKHDSKDKSSMVTYEGIKIVGLKDIKDDSKNYLRKKERNKTDGVLHEGIKIEKVAESNNDSKQDQSSKQRMNENVWKIKHATESNMRQTMEQIAERQRSKKDTETSVGDVLTSAFLNSMSNYYNPRFKITKRIKANINMHRTEVMKTRRTLNLQYTKLAPTFMSYEESEQEKSTKKTSTTNKTTLDTFNQMPFDEFMKNFIVITTTSTTSKYNSFVKSLAKIKEEEKIRRERKKKRLEEVEAFMKNNTNAPLFINVKDMFHYRGSNEERNRRVAQAYELIVKNDLKQSIWNNTKPDAWYEQNTPQDDYGSNDYRTITRYEYVEGNQDPFENEFPTQSSSFPSRHCFNDKFTTKSTTTTEF